MENPKQIADRIVELARSDPDQPFFLGPIPENRVDAAELTLSVNILGSYRAYLIHLEQLK